MDVPAHPSHGRALLGSLLLASAAVAIGLAWRDSPPARLPGVALGSPLLLHFEKAAAFFTVILLGVVVIVRAFQGDLPSELRGLKYTLHNSETDTSNVVDGLTDLTETLERRLDAVEERLDAPPDPDDRRHALP
jgi:hypothetical protein